MSEYYKVVFTSDGEKVREEGPYTREKAEEIVDDHMRYVDDYMRITHIGMDNVLYAHVEGPFEDNSEE